MSDTCLNSYAESLPRFAWSTPQRQKLKFLPLRRYNLTLNLLSRSHDLIASGRQIAINGHIKFNLTIPLQQLNGLETLVIIMVANKYAFLQITRRRFLNEWEAFKKVISRRNIRRRITIPLTLSNLKLLRRITRTENILHRNFTRRQVAIQNRVASNIGISQSTFSVKVLNLFSRVSIWRIISETCCCLERLVFSIIDATRAVDSFCCLAIISFCAYTWSFVFLREVVDCMPAISFYFLYDISIITFLFTLLSIF